MEKAIGRDYSSLTVGKALGWLMLVGGGYRVGTDVESGVTGVYHRKEQDRTVEDGDEEQIYPFFVDG